MVLCAQAARQPGPPPGSRSIELQVARVDVIPVRVPYRHREQSAVVDAGGVSNVLVRLESDAGQVGWGECAVAASTETVAAAVRAMAPHVEGRDPFEPEAIASDVLVRGRWRYQAMTAAFALAGIDMALADLAGRACGLPVHRLLGGAVRDTVDYFYYLRWEDDAGLRAQCEDGVSRGYEVFYLKVGLDPAADERRLEIVRTAIGPARRLRIDANQAWTPGEAAVRLERWHRRFDLDFAEGPVRHRPLETMHALRRRTGVRLCADEGLRGEEFAWELVLAGCADVLCLSPYDVGTLRRLQALALLADRLGQQVCKHTWGELGIAAAASQHLLLTLPNVCDGNQQTAQLVAGDVLCEPIPIAAGPAWGRIDAPGLGVDVDEARVRACHADYLEHGEYPRAR